MKKIISVILLLVMLTILIAGCASKADVASQNLSTAADNFEINRRIIFYNGITGEYMLTIEGLCSLGNYDPAGELSVTCKVGRGTDGKGIFKKHFLGLSDNVTYFAEQIDPSSTDPYRYRDIFPPTTIVPNAQLDTP